MLPEGWKAYSLIDITKWSSGSTPSKSENDFWGGDIPWISAVSMKGIFYSDSDLKVTEKALKHSAKVANENDILLLVRGSMLWNKIPVGIATRAMAFNQDVKCIKADTKKVDVRFLLYWFLAKEKHLLGMVTGTGIGAGKLDTSELQSLDIYLPCLPEQKKVAQILSTWDNAISATERLLDNSQQRKKALMQQLLTGKKRLPGFEREWEKLNLGSLFKRVLTRNNGQSGNVVTISGQHGLISQKEFFKKSVASEILDGYYFLVKGQFAYNKSYSNGYPMGAIKRLNRYENGVVTTLYICFELIDESNVCGDFFEQYFESGILNRGISQIAHEGGRAHGLLNVKPSDFFSLRIFIPELEEQRAIAKVLITADQEIDALQKRLEHLKLEKKALMQQLLTGKRRVVADADAA